jgi:phosphate-selective porin OprO and OprP
MIRSRVFATCLLAGIVSLASTSVMAQSSTPARPAGFVVPEWKSSDGNFIIKARGRAVHDFYRVSRDFDGGSINGDTENDDLRALRFGVDGQFSPTLKFRADANLVNNQVNWADVYIGYSGKKYELFVGQGRLSTTFENAAPDINFPLPENSLVNTAFGHSQRDFGAVGRVKGQDWQVVGGLYQGNINAGDVLGDDVLRYAQVRGTYALRHKDRDVVQIGASMRVRDTQRGPLLRYATRPAATNYGPRTLDSGGLATGDKTLALEGLVIRGSFMLSAEHEVLWADTARGIAALNGSYVEGTWWLTGETRTYAVTTGTVGQVKPRKSIFAGGPGAIALVGRLEQLDQSDGRLGTRAGRVEAASLGVAWTPVEFVMFRLAASHSLYTGPNAARDGTADVIMGRAQFAF